ncbi:unknown [Firmicutes bacterium CAG:460]|nr:unknown [Firmicutes bacterium CAG:460]
MNKKKLLFFSGFIIIILVFILIVYKNSYKNEIYTEKNDENVKNNEKINKIPGMVSLMLETKAGSGEYKASTSKTWPTNGYELNTEKSGCENGGTLSYNETTKKVIVKTNISDKCYAYFDVIPPDVTLAITNRPTTYGKLGSINCTGSSATYNQQYNRVEISSIDKKYTSCTLNYTDSTSKVNLATYITGLAGTTQGTGQVVNENGYRYEGKNPNNYIWFNNEYWRIIGVFDSASHGQSERNLVKIIRDETMGGISWNVSSSGNWANGTSMG